MGKEELIFSDVKPMAERIEKRLIEANGVLGSMNKGTGHWLAEDLVKHYVPREEYNKLYEHKLKLEDEITQKGLTEYMGEESIEEAAKVEVIEEFILWMEGQTFRPKTMYSKIMEKLKEIRDSHYEMEGDYV